MTAAQIGVNDRALRNAAEKVAAIGYTGDAHRFVESLVVSVLADGYRRIEPQPALHGPSSSKAGRAKAKALFEETRRTLAERDSNRAAADPNGVTR